MKKIFPLFIFIATLLSCDKSSENAIPQNPEKYASTITSLELKEMLYEYAGNGFLGRETGTEGEQIAREFIMKHYVQNNIIAAEGTNDYEQKVSLARIYEPDAAMFINNKQYTYFDDFFSFINSSDYNLTTDELVYVGYGIDDEKYSDYENVDVRGKVVLVKEGEPQDANNNFIISGDGTRTKWSTEYQFIAKQDAALQNGALAVIFYHTNYNQYVISFKRRLGRLNLLEEDDDKLILLNPNIVKEIYPDIDNSIEPKSIDINFKVDYKSYHEALDAKNVVATIKGSEFPNEYVIVSAHLDHLGEGNNGEVYNGADDDGSGTVAVMEIAEAFQQAKVEGNAPRRSLVFLHVTGEEFGLFGSKYYTDINPLYPLENTVANLNIDMVGRVDDAHIDKPNYVYLIGSDKLSQELHEISEATNQKYSNNLLLDYTYNDDNDPNRFYYRSDHYNFAKNDIPVIFYFNGTHADYHQLSDTPDKIEYELLEDRTKLIFHTAWELANRDKRITLN